MTVYFSLKACYNTFACVAAKSLFFLSKTGIFPKKGASLDEGTVKNMAAPRKDDVKAAILSGTEALLEENSFSDITLAQIAQRAGISKGTLYYYYRSKNDIVFDITDKYLDEQWRDLEAWTQNPDKDTSLHRLVRYLIERNISTPAIRMQLLIDALSGNEEIRGKLLKRYADFEKLIAKKISERTDAVPPEYFSRIILLVSDGLFLHKMLNNSDFDTETIIEQTADYIKALE